jgi:uncharacterized RDD family membrane protein YckC
MNANQDECVYYAHKDYVGLWKRFLIILIDFTMLFLCSLLIAAILLTISVGPYRWDSIRAAIWVLFLATSYPYLVLLKRTQVGTLAYWLLSTRIVNLKGNRPSVFQMTFRWLLLIFGPFHFLIDTFWLGGDENKQTLRDKIVGTYVIGKYARPAGQGMQVVRPYYFLGFSFLFREVKRP